MKKKAYQMVNLITLYRLVAAPVLALLLIDRQFMAFRWLLALSFFTDAIDGWLARKFKVISLPGARLDSIADDLTVLVAILGVISYRPDFVSSESLLVSLLIIFYIVQNSLALFRYHKLTSFHTYTAKVAAVLQGIFLILFFFVAEPVKLLFKLTACVTLIDLAEEIVLVLILPHWTANVKGLYWVVKNRRLYKSDDDH